VGAEATLRCGKLRERKEKGEVEAVWLPPRRR